MSQCPKVSVVGSVNMDLVTKAERYPKAGETILGLDYHQFPGGKGANQAVAAARLGAEVSFIGCVGDDLYGEQLKRILIDEGINVEGLNVCENAPTGIAQITVAEHENSIIVVPGANHQLTNEWIEKHSDKLINSDIIIVQLETPLAIVENVTDIASKHDVPVILNPAPAQRLDDSILSKITYLTPNETEIGILTSSEGMDFEEQIHILLNSGISNVILTRGEKGVVFNNKNTIETMDSVKVEVVDTTGAGDTFNGALAVGLANGNSLTDSIEFANTAASHSVTKYGAQSGMPRLEDIKGETFN